MIDDMNNDGTKINYVNVLLSILKLIQVLNELIHYPILALIFSINVSLGKHIYFVVLVFTEKLINEEIFVMAIQHYLHNNILIGVERYFIAIQLSYVYTYTFIC